MQATKQKPDPKFETVTNPVEDLITSQVPPTLDDIVDEQETYEGILPLDLRDVSKNLDDLEHFNVPQESEKPLSDPSETMEDEKLTSLIYQLTEKKLGQDFDINRVVEALKIDIDLQKKESEEFKKQGEVKTKEKIRNLFKNGFEDFLYTLIPKNTPLKFIRKNEYSVRYEVRDFFKVVSEMQQSEELKNLQYKLALKGDFSLSKYVEYAKTLYERGLVPKDERDIFYSKFISGLILNGGFDWGDEGPIWDEKTLKRNETVDSLIKNLEYFLYEIGYVYKTKDIPDRSVFALPRGVLIDDLELYKDSAKVVSLQKFEEELNTINSIENTRKKAHTYIIWLHEKTNQYTRDYLDAIDSFYHMITMGAESPTFRKYRASRKIEKNLGDITKKLYTKTESNFQKTKWNLDWDIQRDYRTI